MELSKINLANLDIQTLQVLNEYNDEVVDVLCRFGVKIDLAIRAEEKRMEQSNVLPEKTNPEKGE